MRNLLAFVAALALTFVGVGWYLDWYKIQSAPASQAGHKGVQIDINTRKIGEDIRKGEKKLHQALDPDSHKNETPAPAPAPEAKDKPAAALGAAKDQAAKAVEEAWNDLGKRLKEEVVPKQPK